MTTAWAHLPNAALIDAVLADVKASPGTWAAVRAAAGDAAWAAAWAAARDAARAAARDAARDAAWDAAWGAAQLAAWGAALDALMALIAWDDCAHLLDLPSDTLRTMADLCDAPVCHQAVMLRTYVLVKENVQEPCRQVTPA